MDSPKPFDVRAFFCPANSSMLDETVADDQESDVSLQLSISCCMPNNTAAIENKGKEHVYSERNSEVVLWEKIKSVSPSSETTHVSLALGLSLSGNSMNMSQEKKETMRFLDEEGSFSNQYQRENDNIGGLSLQLNLDSSDACCSNSKKRKSPSPESKTGVSSCSRSKRRTKVARQEEITTELRLGRQGDDPWCIKKTLTKSDIGHLSRLLLAAKLAQAHILPFWNADQRAKIEEGLPVFVWDCDTKTEHALDFKQWNKGKANIFINNWPKEFVKRRQLKKGDEIGLYWDQSASRFNFSVLNRDAGH